MTPVLQFLRSLGMTPVLQFRNVIINFEKNVYRVVNYKIVTQHSEPAQ